MFRSIHPASKFDITGLSTEDETEANISTPIKLNPLNSDYGVFTNNGKLVIKSVTEGSSKNSSPI